MPFTAVKAGDVQGSVMTEAGELSGCKSSLVQVLSDGADKSLTSRPRGLMVTASTR